MANTILKTRTQLKYDTLARWEKVSDLFIPLEGEACVTIVPADETAISGDNSRPQILIKIGDGVSTFRNLPWISAKAADVYDWAKKASLQAEDVPELPADKITTGKLPDDRIESADIWNAKQDALSFEGNYNASTNKVATESTVRNAINALLEDISKSFTTEELKVTGDTSLQDVTAKNINANQYTIGNDVKITRDGVDIAEGNIRLKEGNLTLQNDDEADGGHGDLYVGGNATFKQKATFDGNSIFNEETTFNSDTEFNKLVSVNDDFNVKTDRVRVNVSDDTFHAQVVDKVTTTKEVIRNNNYDFKASNNRISFTDTEKHIIEYFDGEHVSSNKITNSVLKGTTKTLNNNALTIVNTYGNTSLFSSSGLKLRSGITLSFDLSNDTEVSVLFKNKIALTINNATDSTSIINIQANTKTTLSLKAGTVALSTTSGSDNYLQILEYTEKRTSTVISEEAVSGISVDKDRIDINADNVYVNNVNISDQFNNIDTQFDTIAEQFDEVKEHLDTIDQTVQSLNTVFTDVTVSKYQEDIKDEKYPYKATVQLDNVTEDMLASVIFNVADTDRFAPECETYNGGIYIWSTTNEEVIIPIIQVITTLTKIKPIEKGSSFESAIEVNNGERFISTVTFNVDITTSNKVKYFKLLLTSGDYVIQSIDATSPVAAWLYYEDGSLLRSDNITGAKNNFSVYKNPGSGYSPDKIYYLKLQCLDTAYTGKFTVKATRTGTGYYSL